MEILGFCSNIGQVPWASCRVFHCEQSMLKICLALGLYVDTDGRTSCRGGLSDLPNVSFHARDCCFGYRYLAYIIRISLMCKELYHFFVVVFFFLFVCLFVCFFGCLFVCFLFFLFFCFLFLGFFSRYLFSSRLGVLNVETG